MIKFIIDEEGLRNDPRVKQEYKENPELLKPIRGTDYSAGYDIIAPYDFVIRNSNISSEVMDSYIKLEMDPDVVAYMHIRSSMGIKRYVRLMNSVGVIDADFKDPIKVPLRMFGGYNEHIRAGEKVAQIVFHKWLMTDEDLEDKKNGKKGNKRTGGIGSTGK